MTQFPPQPPKAHLTTVFAMLFSHKPFLNCLDDSTKLVQSLLAKASVLMCAINLSIPVFVIKLFSPVFLVKLSFPVFLIKLFLRV